MTHLYRRPSPAQRWVAMGCAVMVWLLGVFAASSQLHGAIHHGAAHATHTCAITLFGNGIEDLTGGVDLVVAPALFPAGEMVATATIPAVDAHNRLPPVCGPPLR